ncbi:hypothetical protein V2J09_019435 [Rumex salicifolius]
MDDETKNIVVVVEDVEASKTALQWALHNLLRYGDVLTLLHVFPTRSSSAAAAGKKMKKKHHRLLRLKGYQLALSFKELCSNFFNTRIEIVVAEDDDRQEGGRILALVREIGAFALVVGLHDHSFLYKLGMTHNNLASAFNCRVVAVRHPGGTQTSSTDVAAALLASPNVAFSQIDVSSLQIPQFEPKKIPYRICPSPYAIIWRRSRKTRRRRHAPS